VTKPVYWQEDDIALSAEPYAGFRITFTIDYDHPLIGRQTVSFDINDQTFMKEIAPARTFVLERDLELLRQAGWIKGGKLESAVVVGEKGLKNPEPLRFPDEFARHKVLDLLGDLFLLGGPLLGHVRALRSGHQSHVAFVRHLRETLPLPGRRPGRLARRVGHHVDHGHLPHRYPFLLVDRITRPRGGQAHRGHQERHDQRAVLPGPFPGQPIMPACSSSRPWRRSAVCCCCTRSRIRAGSSCTSWASTARASAAR
jgi:hypothetical protein